MSGKFWFIIGLITLSLVAGVVMVSAQEPLPQEGVSTQTALGTAFTYQGQLKSGGEPVNGACDFQFSLWDASSGGLQVGGTQTKSNVSVSDGYFTIPDLDFGSSVFTGDARWLEIGVRCPAGSGSYTALSPRQALTPAPYALALPGLWTQQNSVSPNVIGGYRGNSVTDGGVGATIGGGGANGYINRVTDNYGTVGGGGGNTAGGNATVGGGFQNTASGGESTIGGGWLNTASGGFATVGGGYTNTAGNYYATVSGGSSNTASGEFATVGGGRDNTASETYATISGGVYNTAVYTYTTVGGGINNTASGIAATIAGGHDNTASDYAATIGGGGDNVASESATVGGGRVNTASGQFATVGGGADNVASGESATVGGGYDNTASGAYAAVGGGFRNTGSSYATVGGGNTNSASGATSTVSGGWNNTASHDYAAVGGGAGNTASGPASTVGGGWSNLASAESASVGGGDYNIAGAAYATIAGGGPSDPNDPGNTNNRVTDNYGTIGGGGGNRAGDGDGDPMNAIYATVGGGFNNTASGWAATIEGGSHNTASGVAATIGGGVSHTASGFAATVGGGEDNTASGNDVTVGGGWNNTASGNGATVGGGWGNTASGFAATVPGGLYNTAQGDYSFAAGRRAKAYNQGCFVLADATDADEPCVNDNRFVFRVTNGFYIWTTVPHTAGVLLPAGGNAWSSVSDRAAKENFTPVDGREVLDRLAAIPIQTWNYKSQEAAIRHIGPVAQDFYAAFGVGEDDKHISTIDADGVALAAIQGLYRLSQEKDDQIAQLEKENLALREQLDDLEARMAALEQGENASGGRQPLRQGLQGAALCLLCSGLIYVRFRYYGKNKIGR